MNILEKLTARPSVYLCGPIVGRSYQEATAWRNDAKSWLSNSNITAYDPTRYEHYLTDDDGKILGSGMSYRNSMISHRGYVTRDRNDVQRSDLVLVNFLGADHVSIGSVIELAWADSFRKPVVAITGSGFDKNPHNHPMLMELVDFQTVTLSAALDLTEAILLP